MSRTGVRAAGVTLICCFIAIVLSHSDLIPDPPDFEPIPPDRMELLLEHFQLVLGAIQRLDSRVGNLDKRLEAQDTKLETTMGTLMKRLDTLDSNIEALDRRVSGSLSKVDADLAAVDKSVKEKLIDLAEIKLEALDAKVSGKLDRMEAKLDGVSSEIGASRTKLESVDESRVVSSTETILNMTEESLPGDNDMEEPLLPLKPNELPGDLNSTAQERLQLIGKVLNGTRGRLYTQPNQGGEFYEYDLGNLAESAYEGCIELPRNDFKSVETFNGCVRIFSEGSGCHGRSLSVYPGSDYFPNISNSNFTTILAVGPCLSNEFEFSRLSNDTNGIIVVTKNRTRSEEIPDDALIGGFFHYHPKSTDVNSSTNPVLNYVLSTNNRLLYFYSVIYKRHLTQAAPASQMKSSAAWKLFDKEDGDDLGFVIPPSMGGPGNETYNIFPQSRENGVEWNKVLSEVPRFVVEESDSNSFVLYVNFAYPNESTNRPHGLYYQVFINRPNVKTKIIYGFVRN